MKKQLLYNWCKLDPVEIPEALKNAHEDEARLTGKELPLAYWRAIMPGAWTADTQVHIAIAGRDTDWSHAYVGWSGPGVIKNMIVRVIGAPEQIKRAIETGKIANGPPAHAKRPVSLPKIKKPKIEKPKKAIITPIPTLQKRLTGR